MLNDSFTEELFGEDITTRSNPFEEYGLRRNPFPGHEEEFFKFIYGQDKAKQVFLERFKQFHRDRNVNTLLIVADHRVGKTNFLRYYHYCLEKMLQSKRISRTEAPFLPIYTRAYEYDFFFIYQQVIEKLPEDILISFFDTLTENPLPQDFPDTDLSRALKKVGEDCASSEFDQEERISLFRDWLRGGYRSLNKLQREELGVRNNITNSPVGARFLRDLIEIMRERNILNGLVFFFDEFERLVGAGLSRAQKDRYLNDIRNFISDFQRGAFFTFAITPAGLAELQKIYPAIPPRLGTQLQLRNLESEKEALEFTNKYIDYFRQNKKGKKDILTRDQISNVFLREKERDQKVRQGNFLARLREEAEKNVFQ
jgi:hypothetical protein